MIVELKTKSGRIEYVRCSNIRIAGNYIILENESYFPKDVRARDLMLSVRVTNLDIKEEYKNGCI